MYLKKYNKNIVKNTLHDSLLKLTFLFNKYWYLNQENIKSDSIRSIANNVIIIIFLVYIRLFI